MRAELVPLLLRRPTVATPGWAFRAAVASSLLLSVTMKITTDVASAPIFWVVPLSLYLLTFVLAFSPGSPPSAVARGIADGIRNRLVADRFFLHHPISALAEPAHAAGDGVLWLSALPRRSRGLPA